MFIYMGIISASIAYDFSNFPEPDQVAKTNPDFLQKYDFSKVPSYKKSVVELGKETATCPDDYKNACSWGCTIPPTNFIPQCTVPEEYDGCPDKQDWALSFDDGNFNFNHRPP